MGFRDLDEVFDDTLPLTVGGKVYRIPAADAELGLWCQRVISAGVSLASGQAPKGEVPDLTLGDDDEMALYRRLLGDVWQEMQDDGVSWPKILIVAQTALFWVGSGLAAAEAFWNSGGDPEAFAPTREIKRKVSRSTGGANTTKRRGSSSTTKSRQTSSKR